jgi:phosphoribosylformylglycinamidine cyclo-ligase
LNKKSEKIIVSDNYKSAGVDIEAGDETVRRIKGYAKSTFNKNVLSEIGLFGAFYQPEWKEFKEPVLVSSVDGVGTKLKIAFEMDRHNSIGQDLVNHCVNDIAVCGAKPLFFLDYLAFGKLEPEKAEKIIEGFSIACRQNNCALIGGETAEMPGLYSAGEYDMSGTIVGIVDKEEIIDGKGIKKGDLLFGYKSTGLHTNGYSLARKVLSKYNYKERVEEIDNVLGDELLKVHKSYLELITLLKKNCSVKGFSHITGGGIEGNTKRILPEGRGLKIEWNNWELPPIFTLIKSTGNIQDQEMQKVFNLGIGLIAVISPEEESKLLEISKNLGEEPVRVGEII